MPYNITRENQADLLQKALILTRSTGWAADAIAFGVGAVKGDAPHSIAVFQRFAGKCADLHFCKTTPAAFTRGEFAAITLLAFHHNGLNLVRLWVEIAASNTRAIRTAVAVGFDFEHRKRAGFLDGQEDAIVMSAQRPAGISDAGWTRNQSKAQQLRGG